jgi:hypothetical protein
MGEMKEKPILFSGEMVRAILAGRKTQTRRIAKHIPMLGEPEYWGNMLIEDRAKFFHIAGDFKKYCPYGQPGNRLWVRETWAVHPHYRLYRPRLIPKDAVFYYPASDSIHPLKAKPSIHMPRWASRITLEITGVRVERLQDISEEDARAEGTSIAGRYWGDNPNYFEHKPAFQELWDRINVKRGFGWGTNPWLWVISFKRI